MTARRVKRRLARANRRAGAAEKNLRRIEARAEALRADAERRMPDWMRA